MSSKKQDDTPTEDATVEQIHAAEPAHPEPTPGTPGADPVEDPADVDAKTALEAQIEETRGELGDTVEALTYKLDVKARAKEGIDERKQAAKDGAVQAKEAVVSTAAAAKERVEEVASAAQAKASSAAHDAQDRAADARDSAREATSGAASSAQDAAGQAGRQVQENKVPVATIAAVAGVLVLVVVWRRRSR
ncbi:DUF3618 domain-containing protein [Patulibacter sp.]|uniref:DUF3618 domain-containing protein n=1 Tax=Patulibacter sp. TaxID=1912859 RepID=UPI00271EF511|nr:DUF3618 domain-containing protein [Patulibacter sp.]MDO9410588.1 DUF3618 domain-containing protein [Patulibacter sp.]